MDARGLAILGCLALLMPIAAADDSVFLLPPSALADVIRPMEPDQLPARSGLSGIANETRTYETRDVKESTVTLDEPTILNAISLSRASGIPFEVSQLGESTLFKQRTPNSTSLIALDAGTVLNALTLGVPQIHGGLADVLSVTVAFASTDRLTQRASLGDEATTSGLALLANGIPIDPHDLLTYDDMAAGGSTTKRLAVRDDPTVMHEVSLSRDTARAAAAILQPTDAGTLADLANETLRVSDRGSHSRDVALPQHVALGAIALANHDIAVDAADLLNVAEVSTVGRIQQASIELDRDTVLNALLLGAQA